jgi:dolichol-phosphate mannosyltransferase
MKICVVIPCYKVKKNILSVISSIPGAVEKIFAIDDCCPENTGDYIKNNCNDKRLEVIFHDKNRGVGGAMKTGYRAALSGNYDICIKIDGDGQMNPALITQFIEKIENKSADYVKGNRFYLLDNLSSMPKIRMTGNFGISFLSKLVSGYWELMDPANGFTAITKEALKIIPLDKIDNGYFFENDMLFRLGTFRIAVDEVSIESIYEKGKSSMNLFKVLFTFPFKYFVRLFKRVFYNYFLRDFNLGSMYIILSTLFLTSGTAFGIYKWIKSYMTNIPSTAGTVMIPAVLVIFGMQFFISAINYDLSFKRRIVLKK